MSNSHEDGVDQPRIERAVREILFAIGEDPDREGLLQTPARVARAYAEFYDVPSVWPISSLQRMAALRGPAT